MESEAQVEVIVGPTEEYRVVLGEGPIWHHEKQVLYWLDIRGKKIFIYDPATNKNEVVQLDQMPGCSEWNSIQKKIEFQ